MPRTALFVIDIQNELAGHPQTEVPGAARIRSAGSQILRISRALADAAAATPPEDSKILLYLSLCSMKRASRAAARSLQNAGVDHIIAFGLQSECCVAETCKGALAASFRLTLLQGAHSTYDEKQKTAADIERQIEEMLVSRGAEVVPWESAVSRWETAGVVC
ncbi:hypothetical protein MY8738_008665 [Beauveria namnaoensis]